MLIVAHTANAIEFFRTPPPQPYHAQCRHARGTLRQRQEAHDEVHELGRQRVDAEGTGTAALGRLVARRGLGHCLLVGAANEDREHFGSVSILEGGGIGRTKGGAIFAKAENT